MPGADSRSLRWAERGGYNTELIGVSPGEVAGIKSATVRFEGDPISQDRLNDLAGIKGRMRVAFLSTGTAERDGPPVVKRLHDAWDRAGVKHVYYESPDTAQEWLTWRRSLREFAPLLFQK